MIIDISCILDQTKVFKGTVVNRIYNSKNRESFEIKFSWCFQKILKFPITFTFLKAP